MVDMRELGILFACMKAASPRPVLFAVEYDFDDGAVKDGRGDALMLLDGRLLVVEVKDLDACGCAEVRWWQVQEQAQRYARRVNAWIQYLAFVDGGAMLDLAALPIVPAALTSERCKIMELPTATEG